MTRNLIPIPRIESRAPNKNTIEWEIPGKVSVGFMLIDKVGYFVFVKVKIKKQHWWNRSWKTFTTKSHDLTEAIINALDALEKYGFYIETGLASIDAHSISRRSTGLTAAFQYGERVGNPHYSAEIKEAMGILDKAEEKFGIDFDLVREHIEKGINENTEQFLDVVGKGRSVRKYVYSMIATISGDMVENGQYHLYRGVINHTGQNLLQFFDSAMDELVKLGDTDKENAETQKKAIRENIKKVG